jgi:hypothetical protein
LLLAGAATASTCTSVALARPASGAREDVTCRATQVHYTAGQKGGLSPVPWVKLGRAGRAYLFFYGSELADGRVNRSPGAVIYTHGGTGTFSTKILWAPAHAGRGARVSATRVGGAGSFTLRLKRAGQVYPSVVSIPAAGCWKLTLSNGKSRAAIVVRAVDPPPTPACDATPVRRDAPDPGGGQAPWIRATPRAAGITGTLFYSLPADSSGAVIYPNGQAPGNAETKILWEVPDRAAGRSLVVSARRLDAPGLVARQVFPAAHDSSPGVPFPSSVDVPSTGCWLLTVRTGKAAAIAVFRSIPAP